MTLYYIQNYSDGKHLLSNIASKLNCTVLELQTAIDILKKEQLLAGPFIERQELN